MFFIEDLMVVIFQLAIFSANDRMKEVNDMYAKVLVRSLVPQIIFTDTPELIRRRINDIG